MLVMCFRVWTLSGCVIDALIHHFCLLDSHYFNAPISMGITLEALPWVLPGYGRCYSPVRDP